MLYSTIGNILASLSFDVCFDSSVLFLYLGCLKSRVVTKMLFKGSFCSSKVKLFSSFAGFSTSARYTTFGVRYLFCSSSFLWIYSYNHILYLELDSKYSFCVTKLWLKCCPHSYN